MKRVVGTLMTLIIVLSIFWIFASQAEAISLPPVGYWKFDEGSGTVASDSSGNGNTGTLTNGPQWVNGKVGKALKFDGANDYVFIPHSSSLDISGNEISVEFWMKLSADWHPEPGKSWIYDQIFYDKGNAYTSAMIKSTGALRFNIPFVFPYPETNKNSWDADTWYHIAEVFDGTQIRIFINGALDKTETVIGSVSRSDINLAIGSYCFGTSNFFNGVIDEFAIYDYTRTAEEIWNDYTRARFSPTVDGYSFDNLIPKESVCFWDAYNTLSSATWISSIPATYWPLLAWLSVAVHNCQCGNCFGMSYTAKYYYENPSLFASNYLGYRNMYEVNYATASPEIIVDQFPGQEIIPPYLFNYMVTRLGLGSLNDLITWIMTQCDMHKVVQLYIDVAWAPLYARLHSVLVYNYESTGDEVILHVYDPNHHGDTSYIILLKDGYGNFAVHGGNLVTEYGVSRIWSGEYYDVDWAIISGHINEFLQLVRDFVISSCSDFLGLKAESPVNILATDPNGFRVGYDPSAQVEVNEITGATYSGAESEPQIILIPSPLQGIYTIETFGTEIGTYTITVDVSNEDGSVADTETWTGTTSPGQRDTTLVLLQDGNLSPPAPPVGGKAIPINIPLSKPETPTLWIWLTTIILLIILTVVYVTKRKRHTKINYQTNNQSAPTA